MAAHLGSWCRWQPSALEQEQSHELHRGREAALILALSPPLPMHQASALCFRVALCCGEIFIKQQNRAKRIREPEAFRSPG
jgi:hypothetical protein